MCLTLNLVFLALCLKKYEFYFCAFKETCLSTITCIFVRRFILVLPNVFIVSYRIAKCIREIVINKGEV